MEISGGLPIMDIGKILQDARIAKNVSLDTAAQETNIRRNYLEAIENNDFASLPGTVFVKGIMRTYGNYLGLDGAKLVEEFKTSLSGNTAVNNNAIRESKGVRVRPSFKSNRDIGSGTDSNRNLFLMILCGVLVLLLAAGGVYYYLNRSGQGIELSVPFLSDTVNKPKTEAKENPKADDSSQKKEAERSASGHLAADDKKENLSASAKEKNGVTAEKTAAKKEESTVKEKDGAANLKKEAASNEKNVTVNPGLTALKLTSTGKCWLRVTDAKGAVLYEGTLLKGETREFSKEGKLTVNIGNLKDLQIEHNGKVLPSEETNEPVIRTYGTAD